MEDYERIAAAANVSKESLAQFLLEAALSRADTVLGPMTVTAMPADQYKELLAALDSEPKTIPEIAAALQRPLRFRHR